LDIKQFNDSQELPGMALPGYPEDEKRFLPDECAWNRH
jgi:hypothetical protein